jgi:hypothetical protein
MALAPAQHRAASRSTQAAKVSAGIEASPALPHRDDEMELLHIAREEATKLAASLPGLT